ncbi:MAG: asparagine synthase B, partial [Glaciecola sp.]|nr:asparagine synthase B [Glaciecola sp.]
MCGIFGILDIKSDVAELRTQALELSKLLRHRGPDWSGIWNNDKAILCHERLAIVDVDTGAQPLISSNGKQALAVNGEIYNHKALADEYAADYDFATKSDCEVIIPLYQRFGPEFIDKLEGMFAFVIYDETNNTYLIARDHIGIIPLYTGYDEHGNFYVASEMKALAELCDDVSEFPPGHIWSSDQPQPELYFKEPWMDSETAPKNAFVPSELNQHLTDAVKSHLMGDVPYGLLISGGLDSSVIAAIAQSLAENRVDEDGESQAWWPRAHSFSIGLE